MKKLKLRQVKKVFNNYRKINFLNQRKYYREVYLFSDEWREKRDLIMDYYGNICQDCNEKATEVHHLHYKNIFKEKFKDLIPLCRSCHKKRHAKDFKENEGLSLKKIKNYIDNSEFYNCHKCGEDFKSQATFIDLDCPKCGNNWEQYGFH